MILTWVFKARDATLHGTVHSGGPGLEVEKSLWQVIIEQTPFRQASGPSPYLVTHL